MFSPKQEQILSKMSPAMAELIRESLSSKHRMHQPHMDMVPVSKNKNNKKG